MLLTLSPPEKLGAFFRLYSIAGRLSAAIGPALTAVLLTSFEGRGPAVPFRVAGGSPTFTMILGIFLLFCVLGVRPDMTVDEYAPLVQGKRTGIV